MLSGHLEDTEALQVLVGDMIQEHDPLSRTGVRHHL